MARVGYTRVSSEAQHLDRQLDGIARDKVFADKVSGKTTQRPKLDEMLNYIRDGDTVVVHSMDRLARNLDDLRQLVRDRIKAGETKAALAREYGVSPETLYQHLRAT
jgi:DNA invertase Pin-like site-specific DNA recombinase